MVKRQLDKITIERLDVPEVAVNFITEIHKGQKAGFESFELNFSLADNSAIFPNAACPLAGYLDFYRNSGVEFTRSDNNLAVSATAIFNALSIKNTGQIFFKNALNKVWKFEDSDDVGLIIQSFIDELYGTDGFAAGALHSLEWSLSEIMDNVIQHAKTPVGYVMGQIHPKTKHVAFCIFDYGQGIFNSLQTYKNPPKSALDALTLCVKENVTRDKKIGAGNGLFGLYQVVNQNKGRLTITSHGSSITLLDGEIKTKTKIPYINNGYGSTLIDFQLDYKKPISLADALNISGKNYQPVNLRLENLENDAGEIVFKVKGKSSGFGTRQAGIRVRKEVINIQHETGKTIIIDFEGIAMISSSFADEFIGKLVLEFGFFGFNNVIRLRNMPEIVQSIVQRSVSQRMSEWVNGN